jgi:ComF family protein
MASVQPVPEPICPVCGRPVAEEGLCRFCRVNPPKLEAIRSAAVFEGPLRNAIHALKYFHRKEVAKPLGSIMAGHIHNPEAIDYLVPIPLHPQRERERGYNQAALLAQEISTLTGIPLVVHGLVRVKHTRPQVTLNAKERRLNVAGAFRCNSDILHDKNILLIDDVCTTGSTMDAAAEAAWECGARHVWGLTLARAVWNPEEVPSFSRNVILPTPAH